MMWKKQNMLAYLIIAFSSLGYAQSLHSPTCVLIKSDSVKLCAGLANELKLAGYKMVEFDNKELTNKLLQQNVDLLVVADAAAIPFKAADAILNYIENGGDIIALNAPLWEDSYDNWNKLSPKTAPLTPSMIENTLFTPKDINDWVHSVSNGTIKPHTQRYHHLAQGMENPVNSAVHVRIPDIDVWDTLDSPQLNNVFPQGHSLTVFYAKGSSNTNQLYIEWHEKDGSKWFATVPLVQEWRQYVLTPEDFYAFGWSVTPTTGEKFRPENAIGLKIGLFKSHVSNLNEGAQEYWIGSFGTAKKSNPDKLLSPYELPTLDLLSPWYKFFDCHDVVSIKTCQDQSIADAAQFPRAELIRSPHPRAKASGFDKKRAWRWIPLLQAESASGEWRGTPAALMIHSSGKYRGGMWASYGIGDVDWYLSPQALKSFRQIVKRMLVPVFIMDGGSNFYTYFENQSMRIGMRVANLGKEKQSGLVAKITLSDLQNNQSLYEYQWPVDVNAGEETSVEKKIETVKWPTLGFHVRSQLIKDGNVIDIATNTAHLWKPKPANQRSYITTKNGNFTLSGKRWRANGINYLPSSGTGSEDYPYMNLWLGHRSYDQEVIYRDLMHIKDLGFNSVSIFIEHESLSSQNLLDFLRIVAELDLKVNLALRPGTPMDFEWNKIKDLLEYYKISEHDCVFALDLAWEPEFGRHDERKGWDTDWADWIVERYTSLANAQSDWGFAVPKEEGKITNPLDVQIASDGQWRKMVAAYRRFLDTLLYEKYSCAKRLVNSVDPNHLVSFRMAKSGDPTYHGFAYDWPYLAAGVDILEPEAYGRIGGWNLVKPGWFTFEYARWAAPQKPMLWAEAGYSVFDVSSLADTDTLLQKQAVFYENFYRMLISSGTDGIFSWWYPGGYRVNERTDFGVINPDGTDRPVCKILRAKAQEFINGPSAKPVNHWIEIDRDSHTDGLYGIYAGISKEFWKAIESGAVPGLRTTAANNSSANCALTAVGNSDYNGKNPPKFLDGFFDMVEVKNASGEWVNVRKGGIVEVCSSEPVIARITLTNLCEPVWLCPKQGIGEGGVYIVVERSGQEFLSPLPQNVPRFATAIIDDIMLAPKGVNEATAITLTLSARERATFGPRFSFKIMPAQQQ